MSYMTLSRRSHRRILARFALEAVAFGVAAGLTVTSAIWAKEARQAPMLAAVDAVGARQQDVLAMPAATMSAPVPVETPAVAEAPVAKAEPKTYPEGTRFYDGRPIRPVRTIMMTVTAYSPDARSCGKWADGITASNYSVWTNGMRLVAADTKLLPMGTLLSVPGYADGDVVPVLDRGGAIKGRRLDVLYPTHEIARKWGVQRIPVTVYEYAD